MTERRKDALRRAAPIAVPILLIVALLGPQLIGARSLASTNRLYSYWPWIQERPIDDLVQTEAPLSDNWDSTFPKRVQNSERIRSGDLPLWTPYVAGGSDLAPNAGGLTFASNTMVWTVVPDWYAPGLAKAIELLAAWGFIYLFARRLPVGRGAATLGGLVFAISGFQVAWINWQHTTTNMWVAGCLWSWDRVRERPTDPARIGIAALTTGAALVEGFPAVALLGLGAVSAVMVVRVLSGWSGPADAARSATGVIGAALLGLGLASVVLLPFSSRMSEYEFDRAVSPDFNHGRGIATVLSPNSLGTAERYFGPGNFVETVGYLAPVVVGIIAAGTAIALIERRRLLLTLSFTGAGAVALLYSYGFEPIYDALRWLPVLNSNAPGRTKAIAAILLTVSAALSFDNLRGASSARRSKLGGLIAATAMVAACLLFLTDVVNRSAPSMQSFVRGEVIRASFMLVAGLIAVIVLLWRRNLPSLAPRAAIVGLLLLVLVDSAAWIRPYWPSSRPGDFYPDTAAHLHVAENIDDDRLASLASTFFAGSNAVYGFRTVHGHTFQVPTWTETVQAAGATFVTPTNSTFRDPDAASNRVLDRLGVTMWADPPDHRRCEVGDPGPATGTRSLRVGDSVTTSAEGLRGVTLDLVSPVEVDTFVTVSADDGRVGTTLIGTGAAPGSVRYLAVPEPEPGSSEMETLTVTSIDGDEVIVSDQGGEVLSPCSSQPDGLNLTFAEGANIYERPDALPRVRWASESVVVEEGPERLGVMATGELGAGTVVLHEPSGQGGGSATIERLETDGDRQAYRVRSDGPGWLVVADPLQTGWQARIDGRNVDLVPAEHGGIAVEVPEGDHFVTIDAQPDRLQAGRIVSAGSGVTVAALLLLGAVRSRRGSKTDRRPNSGPDHVQVSPPE